MPLYQYLVCAFSSPAGVANSILESPPIFVPCTFYVSGMANSFPTRHFSGFRSMHFLCWWHSKIISRMSFYQFLVHTFSMPVAYSKFISNMSLLQILVYAFSMPAMQQIHSQHGTSLDFRPHVFCASSIANTPIKLFVAVSWITFLMHLHSILKSLSIGLMFVCSILMYICYSCAIFRKACMLEMCTLMQYCRKMFGTRKQQFWKFLHQDMYITPLERNVCCAYTAI